MARSIATPLLLLASLLLHDSAQANFFSRILKPGETGEGVTMPSGARSATGSDAQVGTVVSFEEGVLMAHLANNRRIPLVGVGVGNSPPGYSGALVAEAIQNDKRIRLIETAHASHNEAFIAEGIVTGAEKLGLQDGKKVEVHVATTVWYTHLGYERTRLSVEQSLKALDSAIRSDKVNLKIHLLLNWPRCYENISWMNCATEEANLDPQVKAVGPDPNLNPDGAWKESWKYLEDLYLSDTYPIESIGVANFHLNYIEEIETFARVRPHILQVSLWSLLYDSMLVDYCHKHRIHVQVYNVLHGTVAQPGKAPHAYHHIQKIANELSREAGLPVTPAQTVLAWLIQHGVSIIPGTKNLGHLVENAAVILSSIPALNETQVELVAHAVEAYISGKDMDQDIYVTVSFHAVNEDVMLYWIAQDGSETRIDHIWKGDTFNETTYPNHVFRTYNAHNKDIYVEHTIDSNFGEHKNIDVEL